ncbi:hypothetical protein BH10BDE1_BH10BDE1_14080 [soil metagenome]
MAKLLVKKSTDSSALLAFAKNQWEKSACVIAAPAVLASITADDIFALLVRYCDQARETDSLMGLKFYVNGVRLEPFEALEHLPVSDDGGFTGYHKRMSRGFRDYGLVCDELYSVMKGDFLQTRAAIWKYTDTLFQRVGLPNRFTEIGLYLGNYRKTPFGVHVDRCGVLSLPIVGRKNFRIWKAAVVDKHPELKESFSYDELKSQSSVLSAGPGEMAYWPSSDWHIAESDGSLSVTWSIGVWVDQSTDETALAAVTPLLESKLRTAMKSGAKKTSLKYTEELPAELERAAEALAGLTKKEIRAALNEWWRAHVKSNGFR